MNSRWNIGFAGTFAVLAIGLVGVNTAADVAVVPQSPQPTDKPGVVAQAATTPDNITTAYLAESASKARYEAFAARATDEGYKSVAVLFRATAASQDVLIKKHAAMIQKLSGGLPVVKVAAAPVVKSTRENLEAALAADIGEKNTRYAAFSRQAEADKNVAAVYGFKGAVAAEIEYVKFFKLALSDLDGWKAEGKSFAVCEVCSFLVMGPPPATCPVCSAPREKFSIIK